MNNTIDFLSNALLYPNTISCVPEFRDLLPLIDKYYSYLVRREKYNISKCFDIFIFKHELDEFENRGDSFVDEYMHKNRNISGLTKDGVYGLLLMCAILLERIDTIDNILSTFHEENILTYTNQCNHGAITGALSIGNLDILGIIASYIEEYGKYIVKIEFTRKGDIDELLSDLEYAQFIDFGTLILKFYDDILAHLYDDSLLVEIKEYSDWRHNNFY